MTKKSESNLSELFGSSNEEVDHGRKEHGLAKLQPTLTLQLIHNQSVIRNSGSMSYNRESQSMGHLHKL